MDNKDLVKAIDKTGPRTTKKELEDLLKQARANLLQKQSGKLPTKEQDLKLPDSKNLETWASDVRNSFATNISAVVTNYQALNEDLESLTEQVDKKKKELKNTYDIEEVFLEVATLIEAKQNAKRDYHLTLKENTEHYDKKNKELIESHNRKLKELNTKLKDEKEQAEFERKQIERDFNDTFDKQKRERIKELNVFIASKEEEIKERLKELNEREATVNKHKELIDTFDERLETQVNEKSKSIIDRYHYENNLKLEQKEKALTTQKTIYDNKISSLERELEKAITDNNELKEGIKDAQKRVQEIASTAVQNAKNETHIVRSNEKSV